MLVASPLDSGSFAMQVDDDSEMAMPDAPNVKRSRPDELRPRMEVSDPDLANFRHLNPYSCLRPAPPRFDWKAMLRQLNWLDNFREIMRSPEELTQRIIAADISAHERVKYLSHKLSFPAWCREVQRMEERLDLRKRKQPG